ncbi:hypothetical protein DRO66_05550 [Candidatus Bathyarchaeota archaeon]|nr:MAG: hypothetical protein DRO66_05550 [Candidatus Bathyarchaeota archaeon]
MSIGPDIKEALVEVGTSFTIMRESGDVAGGYLDVTPNTQVTKPFIREFFLEVMLSYDTEVLAGEIVELDTPGTKHMLANKTADMFENEIIKYDGVLYQCNVSGELLRPSGEADWNDDYQRVQHWESIKDPCYALLTTPVHGGEIETDEAIGLLDMERVEMYIQSSVGIQELDRYQPASGEYYRVEAVKKRRYPGIDVVLLGEDTR